MEEEKAHDLFYLHHTDGTTEYFYKFEEVFADNIVRHFVDFLRGCGHFDDPIYSAMREISDEYFESQEKKQNDLRSVLKDVDSDPVLG